MPLLEINQRRYIRASVRLDESAAKQVDRYPLSSTHPQAMCWTRLSTMSSRRTLIPGLSQDATGQTGWPRELLLHGVVVGSHTPMDMHIFTELVGIQMLLMNTLEPLLRGDKLAREHLSVLFRQVQTTQAAKAQELLAKRSRNNEK
jgi:hypothetical protein